MHLETNSLLRYVGTRVVEHRDGFPVIPVEYDRHVLTTGQSGVMCKISADHLHCVSSFWNPLRASGFAQNTWQEIVPSIESIFLCNSLALSDLPARVIAHIDDVADIMAVKEDEPVFLLLPASIKGVPEGKTIFKNAVYGTLNMVVPHSHPNLFKRYGYLIKPRCICYDVTDVIPDPDGFSGSWNIRLIISDPCHVQRFILLG
jgi:hypothetical protein